VVAKLTAKDPAARYQRARDIVVALQPFQAGSRPGTWVRSMRRWPLVATAAVAIAALLSFVAWSSYRTAKERWARDQALPQALDLTDEANYRAAFALAVQSGRYIFPVELSQKPFFERLGTSPVEKKYLVLAGGHSSPRNQLIQAVLGGLDRYLRPVERR
jgi:hypothetical protein